MAERVLYLGSVTLTPYHTQAMLPWVLSDIVVRSKEAEAATDVYLSYDDDYIYYSHAEDGALISWHGVLDIARFVRPRSISESELMVAYLQRDSAKENLFIIHAIQCYTSESVKQVMRIFDDANKRALARKSEREIAGDIAAASLGNFEVKLSACGTVQTRTLTSVAVDEIASTKTKSGLGSSNVSAGLQFINRRATLRIGPDQFYLLINGEAKDSGTESVVSRKYRDVTGCSVGKVHCEYLCIVCRENNQSVCYCLKSDDPEVTFMMTQQLQETIRNNLKALQANRVSVCSSCPMQAYHTLCKQLEGIDEVAINSAILARVHELTKQNEDFSLSAINGMQCELHQQNEMVMSSLRQYYEKLQHQHRHAEEGAAALKGSLFGNYNKAKKSLQGSFLEIKQKKNELVEEATMASLSFNLPMRGINSAPVSPAVLGQNSTPKRNRTGTKDDLSLSPRGHGWKSQLHPGLERNLRRLKGKLGHDDWLSDTNLSVRSRRLSVPVFRGVPTWRQNIYTLVTTPIKKSSIEPIENVGFDDVLEIPLTFLDQSCPNDCAEDIAELPGGVASRNPRHRKTPKRDYRALWKRAILDQILLIRMEKENSNLQGCFLIHLGVRAMVFFPACQDVAATNRTKLDFEEIIPCPEEVSEIWTDLFQQPIEEVNRSYVFAAVKTGIPRSVRGEAWKFLREYNLHRLRESGDTTCDYQYDYDALIRKKSKHQNDIFLDLDRTFPSHPYFSVKYGAGQLALYNVLRAYSVVDDDVGYCQGMSFVASVLLMHLKESESFELLVFMMHQLNLRRQYRPPNMTGLQVKQYQLQRLMHDRLPRLDAHLQKLEIPPTLYATPWFLTLFSSQYPIGLVVRIFDLLLLDGPDIIFKMAVVILSTFEKELLTQSTFEGIVGVFKTRLPELVAENASDIINKTFNFEFEHLHKQLFAYEVEYQVMREEELANSPGGNSENDSSSVEQYSLEKVAARNKKLIKENYELELKAEQLKRQNYEMQDTIANLQREESKLHTAIFTLLQERDTLAERLSALDPSQVEPLTDLGEILPSMAAGRLSHSSSSVRVNGHHGGSVTPGSGAAHLLTPNGHANGF